MVLDIVVGMRRGGGGAGAGALWEKIEEMGPTMQDSGRDCGNDLIGNVFAAHSASCVFLLTCLDTGVT